MATKLDNNKKVTKMSSIEIDNFLDIFIEQNKAIQENGWQPKALNIIGSHGLGKTTKVRDYAMNHDMQFIEIILQNMEETGELAGLPITLFYMCGDIEIEEFKTKTMPDGTKIQVKEKVKRHHCAWVPKEAIPAYEGIGYKQTGEYTTDMATPKFLQDMKEGKGILFLDDFTRAPQHFQQAIMSIFLDQKTQYWSLPKGWTVIGTSNPATNNYNVEQLDAAQEDRMFTIEMKFDKQSWAEWADKKGIDYQYIKFILDYPEFLDEKSKLSPRSVTGLFEMLKGMNFSDEKTILFAQNLAQSRCGVEFSTRFITAMHNKQTEIPTAEDIMSKDWKDISMLLKKTIGSTQNGSYRADISWLVMSRLKNYLTDLKANNNQIIRFRKLLLEGIFNDNQVYQLAKNIMLKNNAFAELLVEDEIMNVINK